MILRASRVDDGWLGTFAANFDEDGWIQYSAQPFDGNLSPRPRSKWVARHSRSRRSSPTT
jgi:hypothetical protein